MCEGLVPGRLGNDHPRIKRCNTSRLAAHWPKFQVPMDRVHTNMRASTNRQALHLQTVECTDAGLRTCRRPRALGGPQHL